MKTLQVVFYGDPNGYPPIINIARGLCEAGWEVEILCRTARTHGEVAWPEGVSIRRLASGGGHRWLEYLRFVWEARRFAKPGTIVAGHDMHGLVAAYVMAGKFDARLAYHCHDFTEAHRTLPLGSRLVKLLERPLAGRARLVIAPDARRAAVIESQLALRRSPLIVPNAPPARRPAPRGRLRAILRDRGYPFEGIVLRQGRIGPGHGIESTIRSMPHWKSDRWGFVLIGPAESSFASELKRLAGNLGVERRFAILPAVPYDEVMDFTIEADVGHAIYDAINVNHEEMGTASNKVLEYMAAGIPCIATANDSFRSLISATGSGLLVDPTSPEDISDAVNRLLSDTTLARELGRSGRREFEGQLSLERHLPRLAQALENLLAEPL